MRFNAASTAERADSVPERTDAAISAALSVMDPL
jgi:hypothetical protein